MGRGAQKERQLFDFEDISRFGALTLDEHEEAYLRSRAKKLMTFTSALETGLETLSQGKSASIFSEIESSVDVKNALREGEPAKELEELLRALGKAYVARGQGISSQKSILHQMAAPYAIVFGIIEPATPHIVREEKWTGEILHLRERADDTKTLCGESLTTSQLPRFRGSFQEANISTCYECEQEVKRFGEEDPVYRAATETTAYGAMEEREIDLLEIKLGAMARTALSNGEADDQLFIDTAKTEIMNSIIKSLLSLTPSARLKALIQPSPTSSAPMREALDFAQRAIKANYKGKNMKWPNEAEMAKTLSLVRINLPLNVIRCEMAAHLIARHFPLAVSSFYDQMDMNGTPQLGTREISDIWRNHYPKLLLKR
jgi:hypothetical protein